MACPIYPDSKIPTPIRLSKEENACIGVGLDLSNPNDLQILKNYWNNKNRDHLDCTTLFFRKINSNEGLDKFSKEGFEEVEEDFNFLFSSYFSSGYEISVPGDKTYDSFQQTLISACSNNPQYQLYGACQQAANFICKNCTSKDVTNNTDLLKLCGCQVSSLEGFKEYDSIPKECDPLCTHEQVVKNRESDGTVKECNSTVCVINNISINAANSIIGGSSFTQVCPQCIDSGCTCILDATIPDTASTVGINDQFQFTQYCGQNSVCLTIDPITNASTVVECNTTINPLEPTKYPIIIPNWIYFFVLFILIIMILAIFVYNKTTTDYNSKLNTFNKGVNNGKKYK